MDARGEGGLAVPSILAGVHTAKVALQLLGLGDPGVNFRLHFLAWWPDAQGAVLWKVQTSPAQVCRGGYKGAK